MSVTVRPSRAEPAREIEVLENRDVAIAAELFKEVAPNEKRLVAEMPAEEPIAQAGEAGSEREGG